MAGFAGKVLAGVSGEAATLAEKVRSSVVVIRGDGGGQGSGVIWRQDGLVVTNDHVVARDRAEVALADGRTFVGDVIGRDRDRDLATLRLATEGLPPVPVADSRKLRPGELVIAVGNPLGLKGAVAVGIIAGLTREVSVGGRRFPEMVQADVDLYPGNSGGPLIDAEGKVVGINSMVTGPGIALAVPSHVAGRFVGDGLFRKAYLGLTVRPVEIPAGMVARSGAAVGHGLMTYAVADGSPAERAGLLPGDVLLALDGQPVDNGRDFGEMISAVGPGHPARLAVLRGGRLAELTVTPEATES